MKLNFKTPRPGSQICDLEFIQLVLKIAVLSLLNHELMVKKVNTGWKVSLE